MSRVLVTGAEGFIGQHLVSELQIFGHEVHAIDRRHGDLTQPGEFSHWMKVIAPTQVVHLAAQVGRLFGEEDLQHTVMSNALMTSYVARACGEAKVPVLYASTSEIYGDQGHGVCFEDTPPLLPHNLYGLSKRWGEEVLNLYAPDGLRIARLSMPYGPGAPPGKGRRAMDTFLWQAYHGRPITVHRGSERSWCHVSDTVRGLRLIMERGDGTYNVGRDDDPRSMYWLASESCRMNDADPTKLVKVIDPPGMQTVVKRLATARLRRLGWSPKVELEDGMESLLKWVQCFDSNGNYLLNGYGNGEVHFERTA